VLLSTNATTKSDSFSFIFLPSPFSPRQHFQLCGILRKNYMKSCKIRSMSVFSCLVLYLVTTWSDLLKMWVEVPRFEVQNVLKNRFIFIPISQKTSKLVVQKKTPKKIINNFRRIFFHSKWTKILKFLSSNKIVSSICFYHLIFCLFKLSSYCTKWFIANKSGMMHEATSRKVAFAHVRSFSKMHYSLRIFPKRW